MTSLEGWEHWSSSELVSRYGAACVWSRHEAWSQWLKQLKLPGKLGHSVLFGACFREFLAVRGMHSFKVAQFIYLQCIAWALRTLSRQVLRRWMCRGWTKTTLHDATTNPEMCFFALCAGAIRLHPVSTTQNTPWESDDKVEKRGTVVVNHLYYNNTYIYIVFNFNAELKSWF